jgi:hypothetical protein
MSSVRNKFVERALLTSHLLLKRDVSEQRIKRWVTIIYLK